MRYRIVACTAMTVWPADGKVVAKLHRYIDNVSDYDNAADAMSAMIRMNAIENDPTTVWSIVATATITEGN